MSKNKEVEVMQSVYEKNDEVATNINLSLTQKGIYAINVMGAPGAGKTSTLIQIIKGINDEATPYVIEGDIEADFDTKALLSLGVKTIQINTGGACHLDSPMIGKVIDDLDIKKAFCLLKTLEILYVLLSFRLANMQKC